MKDQDNLGGFRVQIHEKQSPSFEMSDGGNFELQDTSHEERVSKQISDQLTLTRPQHNSVLQLLTKTNDEIKKTYKIRHKTPLDSNKRFYTVKVLKLHKKSKSDNCKKFLVILSVQFNPGIED